MCSETVRFRSDDPNETEALFFALCSGPFAPDVIEEVERQLETIWRDQGAANPRRLDLTLRLRDAGAALDPTKTVTFALGDRCWRIHPGQLRWPLDALRRLRRVAQAIDDDARSCVGLAATEVLEAGLALMDAQAGLFEEWWVLLAHDLEQGLRGPTQATRAFLREWRDLEVFHRVSASEDDLGLLRPSQSVEVTNPSSLTLMTVFGARPQPAARVISALEQTFETLLGALYEDQRRGMQDARARAERRLSEHLWEELTVPAKALGAHVIECTTDGATHPHIIVAPASRHVTVVTVTGSLRVRAHSEAIRMAARSSNLFRRGSRLTLPISGSPPDVLSREIALSDVAASGEVVTARIRRDAVITRVMILEAHPLPEDRIVEGVLLVTLDELIRVARDCASEDRLDLWAFLEELATAGTDVLAVYCDSILDPWSYFRKRGIVGIFLDDMWGIRLEPFEEAARQWDIDASLSAADVVFSRLGVPLAESWPVAIPAVDDVIDLWSRDPHVFMSVSATPPFVICIEPESSWPRKAFSCAVLLKDMMITALRRMRPRWPPTPVLIRLVRRVPQDGAAQLVAITGDEEAWIGFDEDAFERTTALDLYRELGAALARVAAIDTAPEPGAPGGDVRIDRQRLHNFFSGWMSEPPTASVVWYERGFVPADDISRGIPLSRHSIIRARLRLFDEIQRMSLQPRRPQDSPSDWFRVEITRAVEIALRRFLRRFDPNEALDTVMNEWDKARASSFLTGITRAGQILAPWTSPHAALEQIDPALGVRAAEILFELVQCGYARGRARMDPMDYTTAASVVAAALEDSQLLALDQFGLARVRIFIGPAGVYGLDMEINRVDWPAYRDAAQRLMQFRVSEGVSEVPLCVPDEDQEFVSVVGEYRRRASVESGEYADSLKLD